MDYAVLFAQFSQAHAQHGWPRQRLLHACLRAAIRSGTLGAGTRLLATRQLASDLGVSRNTVLYAYEQLATEGYVQPDRRGTRVADVAVARPAARTRPAQPPPTLSRRSQTAEPLPEAHLMGAFVPGVPSLVDFPLPAWQRLMDRAWRATSTVQLNYGGPAGQPLLREAIAEHLRASRGVVCEARQVFVTDGTQSSLDLCAHAFADAGDTVWLENPGYRGALTAFKAAELRVHGIPVDVDGMAPSADDWRQHAPKLVYATPSHQYPLGSVLNLPRRLALIAQAQAAGALLIEDDYDSEFRHDGPPLAAMQGLLPDAPVLYLGTFSKTMFPALRIGFIVVPQNLVAPLERLVTQSVPRGRAADQLALAEFLRSGQFATHLRRMRRLYRQRRDALHSALEKYLGGVAQVYGGSAGMHLALGLDASIPDVLVSAQALQKGIVAHPLSAHAVGDSGPVWNGLMLGYAQVPAEQMDAAVKKLAAIVRKQG
ncbi:GntR family transcriptional regulator/MocR family aminotransferase [Rhodoferax ferrireducens]|uniref:GntR family transcriptional regulator/MocR family aminotransferase n=1 Tax=Rhodoferax ferrireducens TaxID=192843 RepID=A0ABU2CB30_9BURK|nr:PLP-dependent aminotransferase family protein [Rhodoferax ferrireducens]MDR7378552.1 GntR family transcriptional regulator/MocR family aminotransferase [Rhodoferax ferrireducens]